MGRPRTVTDDQVIAAARAVFLERGAKAPISAIAETLGVSHAAILQRFGTKRALLIAALGPRKAAERPYTRVAGPPDARPLRVQLVEGLCHLLVYFRSLWPSLAVLREAGVDVRVLFTRDGKPSPIASHATFEAWLREAQRQGRLGPCDPHALSIGLAGAMTIHGLVEFQFGVPATTMPDEAFVGAIVDAFLTGLVDEKELGKA